MQDRHTVLVVDDEPAIRQMFEDILTGEGSDVVSATDGRQALEMLHDGTQPCVILLDLLMPRMNGWQFAASLRADEALRRLPFAIVAANPRFRPEAERLGAQRWLGKPVDIDDLLSAVDDLCIGNHGMGATGA
jgi:chemosensory pili system protein ChpA (sensor histidine kinase/response regulator)